MGSRPALHKSETLARLTNTDCQAARGGVRTRNPRRRAGLRPCRKVAADSVPTEGGAMIASFAPMCGKKCAKGRGNLMGMSNMLAAKSL